MTRRRALALGSAAASGFALAGCAASATVFRPNPPAPARQPLQLDLGGVRVTALRTGAVAVKKAHREWGGPGALGLPAIALDPRWTGWLPITAWLIEHPDGPILVDTGETPNVAQPGYFDCDPGTRFVYERLLRFDVPSGIGAALRAHGVPPEEVRTVALTHLHSDHAGGLSDLANASFLLSQAEMDYPPQGALPCRWPATFRPTPVAYGDGAAGAFDRSHALTADGAVLLVPTPGHTRGHQSVLVRGGSGEAVLAGDASFSLDQVRRRAVAGICEDPAAARRTLAVLAEHVEGTGAAYLATHDPRPPSAGTDAVAPRATRGSGDRRSGPSIPDP